MKIIIGADSAGYVLKAPIKKYLEEKGIEVTDIGIFYNEAGELTDPAQRDYPLVAKQVAVPVSKGEYDFGIILCGTGIGVGITANKVPGIRASVCHDLYTAHQCVEHDNVQVIALGAQIIGWTAAQELIDIFLAAQFSDGEDFRRRVRMLEEMDGSR